MSSGAILGTLRPARGSLRVTLARWLLFIAAALPAVLWTRQVLEGSLAREPSLVAPQASMLTILYELARRRSPALAALALAAGCIWLGLQLLTAGAAIRLNPARRERTSLWRALCDGGSRALLPYLRVALLTGSLAALGVVGLGRAFAALEHHGEIAGWTGRTLLRDLPLARAVLSGLWVSAIGVFGFWLRVGVALESRPRVRLAVRRTLRLWLRRPLAAIAFHWAVAGITLAAQGGVLLAWGASTPGSSSSWAGVWLGVLLVSGYTWQWRVRAALALWVSAPPGPRR